jgi:hypothetical protein
MRALERWKQIEAQLDPDWDVVRLSFVPEDMSRAAAVLAPLGPGRYGRELRFQVSRTGAGQDRLENLLGRLDRTRAWGELVLVDAHVAAREEAAAAPAAEPARRVKLAEQWDAEIAKLPPGWRDLLAELHLDSTDFLAQAALLGAPLNPSRVPGEIALRFRVAGYGLGGYGTAPEMTRRCLERMDAAGVTGELQLVDALADVDYVSTQGSVWRVAGRAV